MTRKLVLLGAGASVDAGIPASAAMTERLGRELADRGRNRYTGVTHAYNYAVGALIAHHSAAGGDPYAGIDVEQLFSAVQMLANRDELEIAPFVEWAPALQAVRPPPRVPAFWEKDFKRALERRGGDPAAEIMKLIASQTGSNSSTKVFRELESELLSVLMQALQVEPERTTYLEGLITQEASPVRIATLNYDLALETVARRMGKTIDTGIAQWQGGYDWEWEPAADIQLLKLHGSIDWTIQNMANRGQLPQPTILVKGTGSVDSRFRARPGLVFGARGKVRAEGPFLAMLQAFDLLLDQTDQLIVVGYSFRDEHINVAISRWVNSTVNPKLTVVDPAFMTVARSRGSNYQSRLLGVAQYWDADSQAYVSELDLEVVPKYARQGLQIALEGASEWKYRDGRPGRPEWLGDSMPL